MRRSDKCSVYSVCSTRHFYSLLKVNDVFTEPLILGQHVGSSQTGQDCVCLCVSFSKDCLLSHRGPLRGGAPVPTNSNVQRPHLHPTHTRAPSRLRLPSLRQRSRWSNLCHLRQRCRSTLQRSRPPSLNHTHTVCLSAQVFAHRMLRCYSSFRLDQLWKTGFLVLTTLTKKQLRMR